ncbi:MAG TPA: response regulator [Fodinibius sp.]|nr:response regulator [Fodinibius sp.]
MTSGRSDKVLIVEDDMLLSMVAERHIQSMGLQVAGKAVSGEEAVQKAAALDPDVIIMDISLRGAMSGVDAAKQIRKNSQVPVIFLSGSSGELQKSEAVAIQHTCFLDKPITREDLKPHLLAALDGNFPLSKTGDNSD